MSELAAKRLTPVVIIEIGDAGGEPVSAARGADEKDGTHAIRWWHRTQQVVDLEVAVSRKRDAGKGAAMLSKRGRSSAN